MGRLAAAAAAAMSAAFLSPSLAFSSHFDPGECRSPSGPEIPGAALRSAPPRTAAAPPHLPASGPAFPFPLPRPLVAVPASLLAPPPAPLPLRPRFPVPTAAPSPQPRTASPRVRSRSGAGCGARARLPRLRMSPCAAGTAPHRAPFCPPLRNRGAAPPPGAFVCLIEK